MFPPQLTINLFTTVTYINLFTTVTYRYPFTGETLEVHHMPQWVKNWAAFAAGGVIPLAIVAIFLLALWLLDVRDDRKHVVVVNARTPVFIGSGDEDCDARGQITTVEKGVKLPIERFRYQKNCATLDVLLPDGRKGYVVLGVGDVSVKPPLPTI